MHVQRITRLVKTTTNPDFEQLRFIYSQPSFSPDGQMLAFTGQRGGRDVLYLMDMRSRKVVKRIDLELDQVLSPSFSPDGRKVVFSGMRHGSSDLYVVSLDAPGYTQLMKDQYGDLMPQWSPDGKTIAFISDRGPDTDLEILKIGAWKVVLYDVETQQMTILPGQGGRATNPQWAPDGKSIAYVTDRTGIANIFLYDLEAKEHYQLTNVVGAVTAVAEQSPSISWARNADILAFVYYEKTEHAIWKVQNPRALKKAPYRDPVVVAQGAPGAHPAWPRRVVRHSPRPSLRSIPRHICSAPPCVIRRRHGSRTIAPARGTWRACRANCRPPRSHDSPIR